MKASSQRQIRLLEEITKTPSLSAKKQQINSSQKLEQSTMRKSNSESIIKLPNIATPKKTITLPELKSQFQTNRTSKFAFNNKFDQLLDSIDTTIKVETTRTRQISFLIDNGVKNIDNKLRGKSKTVSTNEMEKVMFSEREKVKIVNSYNDSMKSLYTNTPSGITYFKKILHKEEQFGY